MLGQLTVNPIRLDARGVPYKIIEQDQVHLQILPLPPLTQTCESDSFQATGKCRDSAAQRGVSLKQIVKSLVFADSEGEYVHCMLSGHLQIDQKKLETAAGGACSMVEEDVLKLVTGANVGEVSSDRL